MAQAMSLDENQTTVGVSRLQERPATPRSEISARRPVSWRHRLATRIVSLSIVAFMLVLSMIGWTLWLSWQLEGAAAAINDTGSLRMRANRVGLELLRPGGADQDQVRADLQKQADILGRFADGVPDRPHFMTHDSEISLQVQLVTQRWNDELAPLATSALQDRQVEPYLAKLPVFVTEADRLVRMLEIDNAGKTTLLRLSQAVLIALAVIGTLAVVYLLYRWIIRPVASLHGGILRMADRDFSVRLPVNSSDELGALAQGFNHMASQLQSLYEDLGEHVRQKTAELERQNRHLSALYNMSVFLNQPIDIDALCHGFIERVMKEFYADGGSIRVLDPSGERLHIVVSVGFSEALEDSEHCMRTDACVCGEATRQGTVVIRDFREMKRLEGIGCVREGFRGLSVFQIMTPDALLGSYSLHFKTRTQIPEREVQVLEMLGQHLGAALDNRRLSVKARELAVAEERNLVAQGLHDSLAQGLNFLNLQTQMLGSAVQKRDWKEVSDIVPLLKTGVTESYQDVRELLQNFRTRLGGESLRKAVEETIARFRRQSAVQVSLRVNDRDGAPLHPEQQLQVLFILQEALSNIRKHANASLVVVRIDNDRDFEMSIRDDGKGYDPEAVAGAGESHVGISIMQERAARLRGRLQLVSAPGQGTEVSLFLSQQDRLAA
ncbi:MAG: type IV pili methyl-accepting chemotaxis transducer N-terminal domain-containing protein [Lautropia sp.]|nr:type IV pili methyl-accepting chemotaxis transducer N-terminal domain-containing protein [Lautropia sp.]